MSDITFRKFDSFDLKDGDEYKYSDANNNFNEKDGEKEEFLVGYRTGVDDALFSKREFKVSLLNARGIYYNTSEYWSKNNVIPKEGEIYIYADAKVVDDNGNTVTTPQMKIGTGNAWLSDLRFVNQDIADKLNQHIYDDERHIQPKEREFWNNKLNVDPDNPIAEETLLLNRN